MTIQNLVQWILIAYVLYLIIMRLMDREPNWTPQRIIEYLIGLGSAAAATLMHYFSNGGTG